MDLKEFNDYLYKSCGAKKDFSVIRRWIDFAKHGLNIEFEDSCKILGHVSLLETALRFKNYDIASYLTDHLEYDFKSNSHFYYYFANLMNSFCREGSEYSEEVLCFIFDKFSHKEDISSRFIKKRDNIRKGYSKYCNNINNMSLKPYDQTILYKVNQLAKQK